MTPSWNEIKSRAVAFSKGWVGTTREEADAKEWLVAFLDIFGITRRKVATFEHRVKKLGDDAGYIDLLWPGMLLVEMKSRGQNLEKAYKQAKEYCHGLKDHELPRFILISDFHHFRLYDEDGHLHRFTLSELVKNVRLFGLLAGYQKITFKEQDPVNVKAAQLMGRLHDQLRDVGYTGHELEVYLVRILFCLFADDTTIFDQNAFYEYLLNRTTEDGRDLGQNLNHLFEVLNTQAERRQTTLDELLAAFPYVNGKLFEERLRFADFTRPMRDTLLECCRLDWGRISPAIFGSLFQGVMNEQERRNLGAHYTSEANIMKVIGPLFLDELKRELKSIGKDARRLDQFHAKLSRLQILDPACGCGNFLIIAYRELRLLEIELLKAKFSTQMTTNIDAYINLNVDQFYGIEYEEWPAQIAQVAMWLMDHQMNLLVGETFGEYYKRLPLRKSAAIVHGNALRIEWQNLITKNGSESNACFNYILGNPPFIGHQWRSSHQAEDMELVFGEAKRAGRLDYVAAWYLKAARYMNEYNRAGSSSVSCAFVSTNSITQGEQVSILWQELYSKHKIKIHFAHRTFRWTNEATGKAAVHVVIIGFGNYDVSRKLLFEYDDISGAPHEVQVKNISPYLTEGRDVMIESRGRPIHKYGEVIKGSQPTDGGFLILSATEKEELIRIEPAAADWIRPYMGGQEFINGFRRYCLWLVNIPPRELRSMKAVMQRVRQVKDARLQSPTASVKAFAAYPHIFTQIRQPLTEYLVIPEVSSEQRRYLPIGFLDASVIASNKLQIVNNASLFMFGVIQSLMHMAWTRCVCGRMKSDISYSPQVYNNFPWPYNPSNTKMQAVEQAANEVLDVRTSFPNHSLADLYDAHAMPPALVKAHQYLDRAVDLCYRPQAFLSERNRVEFLFELYEARTAGLFTVGKKVGTKKGKEHGQQMLSQQTS